MSEFKQLQKYHQELVALQQKPTGWRNLSDMIIAHFNSSELMSLCFDLGTDYDNLPGTTFNVKTVELIRWAERRGQLHQLLDLLGEARPAINWVRPSQLPIDNIQEYIELVRKKSEQIVSPKERDQLRTILRYWSGYVFEQTGQYPNTELRPVLPDYKNAYRIREQLPLMFLGGTIIVIVVIYSLLRADISVAIPTQTPTIILTPIMTPPPPNLSIIEPIMLNQLQNVALFQAHSGATLHVTFSPDTQQFASSGADGRILLWQPFQKQPLSSVVNDSGWTQTVNYSSDGRLIVAGGNDGAIKLWESSSLEPYAQFDKHIGFIFSAAFSPDGLSVVSGGGDGSVRFWDPLTGKAIIALQVNTVNEISFSPDGNSLAVAELDDGFSLWSLKSLNRICSVSDQSVLTIAFAPKGEIIAIGSKAGEVRLLNSQTCQLQVAIQAHNDFVNAITFSPDGQLIVSGGRDGIMSIITPDGTIMKQIEYENSIETVAFSPDSLLIVTGSADGNIGLWGIKE